MTFGRPPSGRSGGGRYGGAMRERPLGNAQTGYREQNGEPQGPVDGLGGYDTSLSSDNPLTPTGIWNRMFRNRSTGNNPLSAGARAAAASQSVVDRQGPGTDETPIDDPFVSSDASGQSLSTMAAGGPTHVQMWGGGASSSGGPMKFPTGNLGNYASNVLSFNKRLFAPADTQQGYGSLPPEVAPAASYNPTGWNAPQNAKTGQDQSITSKYGTASVNFGSSRPTMPASNFNWGSNNNAA